MATSIINGHDALAGVDIDMPEMDALRFLQEFASDLTALNAVGAHDGHPYQRSIAKTGTFSTISPFDGVRRTTSASVPLADKTIFYAFDGERRYYVVSSMMSLGYPLAALYLPDEDALIKFDNAIWGVAGRHIKAFKALVADASTSSEALPLAAGTVIVHTGDANFAHDIWNIMPGFESFLDAADASVPLLVRVTHESLGPRETFTFIPAGVTVIKDSDHAIERTRWPDATIHVAPGSTFLSEPLKARIVETCQSQASAIARNVIDHLTPFPRRLWVSVRNRDRTITNQLDFLARLCAIYLQKFPDGAIVIDGFSVPLDVDFPGRYDPAVIRAHAEADRATADHLIDALTAAGHNADRLFNVAGFSIVDGIAIAQHATDYFCHHGTVHHKIGWTKSIFGVVHTNADFASHNPSQWAASQTEGSIPPSYVPPDQIVDDEAVATDAITADLRLQNYRFVDDEATARWAVHQM